MTPRIRTYALAVALAALISVPAVAAAFSVDLTTERGHDSVYQPGEAVDVRIRPSDDAYLLVYEIDAEGAVHLLFPFDVRGGMVEGGRTYRLNDERPDFKLVVQGPVGQGYLVAIASRQPFNPLPWYLRPYDPQAAELGYEDVPAEQRDAEGVTSEGKIVGDPFVAMERIRRNVLPNPEDAESFATAYSGYYVHHEVRYPRYLCNDCHRPGYWSWWAGFDPYYATCSVFSVRVNYGWAWGPHYWFGTVPYYVYSWVPGCAPGYIVYPSRYVTSWYGWSSWNRSWGMRRIKSSPPPGYIPPNKYDGEFRRRSAGRALPPGFMAGAHDVSSRGGRVRTPVGASWRSTDDRGTGGERSDVGRGGRTRPPITRDEFAEVPGRGGNRVPASRAPIDDAPRPSRSFQRQESPSPGMRAPEERAPAARGPAVRAPERSADSPRQESPRPAPAFRAPQNDSPRSQPSRDWSPPSGGSGSGRGAAPSHGNHSGGGGRGRR